MRVKEPVEISIESVIDHVTKMYMEKNEAFGCFIRKKSGDMTATLILDIDEDGYWVLEVVGGGGELLVCYRFKEDWHEDGSELSVSLVGLPCERYGEPGLFNMYDEDDDESPVLPEWEWLEDLIDAGKIAALQIAKLEGRLWRNVCIV